MYNSYIHHICTYKFMIREHNKSSQRTFFKGNQERNFMTKKTMFNTCTEELLIIADRREGDGEGCRCCYCNDDSGDWMETIGNEAVDVGIPIRREKSPCWRERKKWISRMLSKWIKKMSIQLFEIAFRVLCITFEIHQSNKMTKASRVFVNS